MIRTGLFAPILFVLAAITFVSCEETEEENVYANWKERNEAFIDSLQQVYNGKQDANLFYVTDSRDKNQNIFFKKNTNYEGNGQKPLLTNDVKIHRRGTLINGDLFTQTFTGTDPGPFDSPIRVVDNVVVSTSESLVNGLVEALQHMTQGERWTLYIPCNSGYGSTDNSASGIPAYSCLIFDLQLYQIVE